MLPQTQIGLLNRPQGPLVKLLDDGLYGRDWSPRSANTPGVTSDFFDYVTPSLPFLPPQTIKIHRQTFTPEAIGSRPVSTHYHTHGLGGNTATEEDLAFEMMKLGRRVVLFDLPGCGLSDWFINRDNKPLGLSDIKDTATFYSAIVDGIFEATCDDANSQEGSFFVGGNSLGGVCTTSIARRFQEGILAERFKGVLNCATFMSNGPDRTPPKGLSNYLAFMERVTNPHSWNLLSAALFIKVIGTYATLRAFSPDYVSHAETTDLLRRSLRPHWPIEEHGAQWLDKLSERAIAQQVYAMLARKGIEPKGLAYQRIAQNDISRPLVGVYAEHDPLLGAAEMVEAHMNRAQSLVIVAEKKSGRSGLGHLLLPHHPKAPAIFFASLMEYLDQNSWSEMTRFDLSGFHAEGIDTKIHHRV